MAVAIRLVVVYLTLFTILLLSSCTMALSQHYPSPSPSPSSISPNGNADDDDDESSPSPAPVFYSAPSDLLPPAPSNGEQVKKPSPPPKIAGDVNHSDNFEAPKDDNNNKNKMKAGVAIGVIAGACVVGVGALVYKKRHNNIRRSEYSYAARTDFL